jgi:hypothetical protein
MLARQTFGDPIQKLGDLDEPILTPEQPLPVDEAGARHFTQELNVRREDRSVREPGRGMYGGIEHLDWWSGAGRVVLTRP